MSATFTEDPRSIQGLPIGWIDSACRSRLIHQMEHLAEGRVFLEERGRMHEFGREIDPSLSAQVIVHDPAFYGDVALRGLLGAGESYMQGRWSADDLTALVRIILRNAAVGFGLEKGWNRLFASGRRLLHALRRNTLRGSRDNIAAHYDLGNEFFELFLDPTMMYSAGIFPSESSSLEEASRNKIARICRKLDLRPKDHLLEIGTGWGEFAVHAAREYGCRVTTTTISQRQYERAVERVRAAGLDDRITVLREDYRQLRGVYDKLVSIEMIEAVGHHYFDTFFAKCASLLKPEGLMVMQAITIVDWDFERTKNTVDFIARYIFPGCCIPSVTAICQSLARKTDLKLFHLEDFSPHYARTLAAWRERFHARVDEVRKLGFDETFVRMWDFYLAYCEGGFWERNVGSVQMILTKPRCQREPILGEF